MRGVGEGTDVGDNERWEVDLDDVCVIRFFFF